jgi:hypothetical protein
MKSRKIGIPKLKNMTLRGIQIVLTGLVIFSAFMLPLIAWN